MRPDDEISREESAPHTESPAWAWAMRRVSSLPAPVAESELLVYLLADAYLEGAIQALRMFKGTAAAKTS